MTKTAAQIASLSSAEFHASEFTCEYGAKYILRMTGITKTTVFFNAVPKWGGCPTAYSAKIANCKTEWTVS